MLKKTTNKKIVNSNISGHVELTELSNSSVVH